MTRQPEMGQIPDAVKKDVESLDAEFQAADLEIRKMVARLHEPLLKKRADIVAKIDGFWPQALTNCVSTNIYIDDDDHALLDHLKRIDVERDVNDPRTCKIAFHFASNDFIADEVLVKSFDLAPDAGDASAFDFTTDLVPVKTSISWKSDDVNLAAKKPTKGDLNENEDEEDDFEPGSFFSSFFESDSPQIAGSIGRAIVEDLYPNAIQHFEMPALYQDEDEEEEEDDYDEDEEDEEDEDDADREIDLEEEEKKRPSKKQRAK
ncbi:hypothetical protein MEQU1_000568 [Malassezia equina]|uniref:Nucleosome assembly protein n=1 Tax=Malassezia equina TaxID=1381935 RepID=A0AAF0IXI6_9BASI|nr:hypothetical protein MEQU1_000568 [Malassezia equina]